MSILPKGRQWIGHCGTRAQRRNLRHLAKKEQRMAGNGKAPIPFHAPADTPLIGQAMTPLTVGVPMMMTLTCNCGPVADRATLTIHPLALLARLLVEKGILTEAEYVLALQAFDTCPHCRKIYSAFFNPQTGATQMHVVTPEPEQVPS